jgi:hypothetical protein
VKQSKVSGKRAVDAREKEGLFVAVKEVSFPEVCE